MKFNLPQSIEILEQTPETLASLLGDLSDEWTGRNEGDGTWSPRDVLLHLIYGEKVDWIPRTLLIVNSDTPPEFEPFDQWGHEKESNVGDSISDLLDEFRQLRTQNLIILKGLDLSESDLDKTGVHPSFGEITLREMLSTWTVHDLNHIAQITRAMSHQYRSEVGPWTKFLRILRW